MNETNLKPKASVPTIVKSKDWREKVINFKEVLLEDLFPKATFSIALLASSLFLYTTLDKSIAAKSLSGMLAMLAVPIWTQKSNESIGDYLRKPLIYSITLAIIPLLGLYYYYSRMMQDYKPAFIMTLSIVGIVGLISNLIKKEVFNGLDLLRFIAQVVLSSSIIFLVFQSTINFEELRRTVFAEDLQLNIVVSQSDKARIPQSHDFVEIIFLEKKETYTKSMSRNDFEKRNLFLFDGKYQQWGKIMVSYIDTISSKQIDSYAVTFDRNKKFSPIFKYQQDNELY